MDTSSRVLILLQIFVVLATGTKVIKYMELSDSDKSLHHLLVDPTNGNVYLAATNTLYIRTSDLQPIAKVSLGPRNDSELCPPEPYESCGCLNGTDGEDCKKAERYPTDSIVKSLILDTSHDVLIVCSNLYYGYCSKVSLKDFTLDDSYFTPVVFNSLVGDTVMLIAGSRNGKQLYVAASRDIHSGMTSLKDRAHMLSQRKLRDFTLSHLDTTSGTASFLDVKSELLDKFPVYFEYGFTFQNYSYFLGVRPKSAHQNEPVSFLVRICNNDVTLHSYVELTLDCNGYNRLVTAYLGSVGSILASDLKIKAVDQVIYASFVNSDVGMGIPENAEESAICLFSLSKLVEAMVGATQLCFAGIGDVGPDHITDNEKCLIKPPVFCGEDDDVWPIQGIPSIPHIAQYILRHSTPGAHTTAIAVKTVPGLNGSYTIGYLGSNKGHLYKGVFESKTSFAVHDMVDIGGGTAIKKDLLFSRTKNELYAVTDDKVVLVSLYNCSEYADCDQCLAAREPHCGWCGLQNKCTEQRDCEITHRSYGWLSYSDASCPVVATVFPPGIIQYETNLTSVQLTLANVRTSNSDNNDDTFLQCKLIGRDYESISPAFRTDQGVNCTPFTLPPPLPEGQPSQQDEVVVVVMGRRWLSGRVTIYDCARRHSCTACVQDDLPCIWCLKTNVCVNRRGDCENQAAVISTTAATATSADLTGPQFCPKIEGVDLPDAYVTRAGVSIRVEVHGRQLLGYHHNGLRCLFMHRNGIVVNATWVDGKIVCEDINLTYDANVGSLHIPLQVFWDSNKTIDNPDNISIEVYKCALLSSNCGECTLLDAALYTCGWCDGRCSAPGDCGNGLLWLGREDVCPNPQITDFQPRSGPHLGKTKVTITGINLGKRIQDVRDGVEVGKRKCRVLDDQYVPSVSLVCETLGTVSEGEGIVQVQIDRNSNITAATTDKFFFKDPLLLSFTPLQGPTAGGTAVTISGQDLDIGNGVRVYMNEKQCDVTSKSGKVIQFVTASQDEPGKTKIKFNFDDSETGELTHSFTYIDNPTVSGLNDYNTITSGGVTLDVVGTNLHSSEHPVMVVRPVRGVAMQRRRKRDVIVEEVGDGNTPYVVTTEESMTVDCQASSSELLQCTLPNLDTLLSNSDTDSSTPLEYDVILDNWSMSQGNLTANDLDFEPIRVYPDPIIHGFSEGENVIPHTGPEMEVRIIGENMDVLNIVPGVQVLIGNTSSEISDIQATYMIVIAPAEPKIINDAGNAQVTVSLGNLMVKVGLIAYYTVSPGNNYLVLAIALGVAIPVIVIIIVLILLLRRRKRKEAMPMRVNNGTIIERTDRPQNVYGTNGTDAEQVPLKEMTADDQQASGEDEEEDVTELQQPFVLEDFLDRIRDKKLRDNLRDVIVPPERLEMKDMIGRGNFGCVYLAVLKGDEYDNYKNTCRVAVKTLQGERLEQATVESFLKEGVIMKHFDHPHVLKLLGVCVSNHENPMVILPYMSNGDLRSYVKDKKKNFTARQLLHLAQQVAEGMAYLSSLNFVHRDLAARNCMIDELDDVKVADFGLTRDLFEKQYFSTNLKEKRGKMPIKWMALESLEEFVFTTKSDVWSFGVLMWELMTRGVTPYPDVDIFDVRNYLASGRRLRKPKYCPENIYKIMLDCWHSDPDIRPSFIDLVNRIELLLNPPKKRISEELNEPMYMNIRKANSTEYLRPSETPGVADA